MRHIQVYTKKGPEPGHYSQAVIVDMGPNADVLPFYVAGLIGDDPKTGDVVKGGITPQARTVFLNLGAILNEFGADYDDIADVIVGMSNMSNDKEPFDKIYMEVFPRDENPPTRTLLGAGIPLPGDKAVVEIKVQGFIRRSELKTKYAKQLSSE